MKTVMLLKSRRERPWKPSLKVFLFKYIWEKVLYTKPFICSPIYVYKCFIQNSFFNRPVGQPFFIGNLFRY